MNIQEAIEVLEKHNKWRRDSSVPPITEAQNAEEVGKAIDMELATGDKWYRGNTSIFDLIEKANKPDPKEGFCTISEACFCGG